MKIIILAVLIFICYPCLLLAQPSISSFTPTSGKIGTAVTISGSGFSTTPSSNIVYFGKVKATVTSAASNSLTVTVPNGATYQPITVNVSNLIARSSKPFLVTFGASEALSSTAYSGHTTFTTGTNPIYCGEGDFDNDGKIDVVTTNQNSSTVSIFRNTATKGVINSSSFATKVDLTCPNTTLCVSVEDVDGDGKLDIIANVWHYDLITIFRNTSSGSISFDTGHSYQTGVVPYFLSSNDFNGDGKVDIVVSNWTSNTVSIYQNNSTSGTISLSAKFDISVGTVPHGVVAEDIDMDGKPDISVTNYNSKNIHILRNIHSSGSLSSSSFATNVTVSTGTANPMGLAVKDIDLDGKNDLVCTYQSSGQLAIFRSTSSSGSISFASASTFSSGTTARSAYVNDMNGDGKPDIVCANIGSNTMAVFQNNSSSGSISLSSAYTFSTNSQPHMALAIDVDGDTKPEIVSCNYNANTISVYRNSVINTEPTTAPTSLSLTNMTGTTVDLSWTNGNGSKRIVLVRQSSAVNSTPVDETDYTAGTTFGSGTQLGTGNYVVYSGSGSSVTITGLITGQTYHFAVFEYNGADATSNFFTSSFGTTNALLPVEFVHFNAALKQQTVELN
ncbi:MAG: FG-GAP-like repeat-containing protein [Bacteroidia bacterium]|nr:FG-GAP-like repeat-containing protein [Bacteroidia bacterium]